MSFILDPDSYCAVLWTTIGSGHSTPSTHPSGMHDWRGVGLGTSPFAPLANHFQLLMELIPLV